MPDRAFESRVLPLCAGLWSKAAESNFSAVKADAMADTGCKVGSLEMGVVLLGEDDVRSTSWQPVFDMKTLNQCPVGNRSSVMEGNPGLDDAGTRKLAFAVSSDSSGQKEGFPSDATL